MDYTVHGILQARILEWVDFPFSRGSYHPRDWTWVSCIAGSCFPIWATPDLMNILWRWIFYEGSRILFFLSRRIPTSIGLPLPPSSWNSISWYQASFSSWNHAAGQINLQVQVCLFSAPFLKWATTEPKRKIWKYPYTPSPPAKLRKGSLRDHKGLGTKLCQCPSTGAIRNTDSGHYLHFYKNTRNKRRKDSNECIIPFIASPCFSS